MWVMRRSLTAATLLSATALLALSAPAGAEMLELGKIEPNVRNRCPDKKLCTAAGRVTGYQTRVGSATGTMLARHSGRIVAWTISLGKPTRKQIAWFDAKLGKGSQAQITVLRKASGKKRKRTTWVTVRHGEPRSLTPYFGKTVTFALKDSIAIKKGQMVALTIPTWAPALADGFGDDVSWRASRPKTECEDNQTQTAQTEIGQSAQYGCLYKQARLIYSAWMVTTPRRN